MAADAKRNKGIGAMNIWMLAGAGLVALCALRLCYAMGRSVGWHARGYVVASKDEAEIRRQASAEMLDTVERLYKARLAGAIPDSGDFMKDLEALAELEIERARKQPSPVDA